MLRIQRNDSTNHRVLLLLQGFIVAEWAELLEHECAELIRSGHEVVLDLSGVSFVGSSGLKVLKRVQAAGVRILGCSPLIAEMLEMERIDVVRRATTTSDGEDDGNHEIN